MNDEERVLCAAIHCDDGKTDPPRRSYGYPATGIIFAGWRHADCFTALQAWSERLTADEREAINRRDTEACGGKLWWTQVQIDAARESVRGFNQGFLTTKGRFVSRVEAFAIAKRAGQLSDDLRGRETYSLTSEDLY